ncbi:type II toxin-antitoxin system death-on-curing family toxin [Paenibacillus sp. GD4]|uniref:type II toxin-antitoxin system death-on-curing family toxin n=1 Tax=Paenibacillus sp. GD4 TaxID=3068890 RepID=UPI002796DB92|nr:type II toxin-antitoxin system death-on-curing family toxin [Paenibacillus sp. GD4]MDQ1911398.1 type II toxin-antitoxin system death-on-curing family toxin [Paenibacillus sp. GD4]
MTTLRYLSAQEVIAINVAMIQRYSPGEQIGVKSSAMLESAIQRPMSSAFGEDAYPTVFEKAAALFESLGQNHPFQNANKRTAFTALVIYLRYNGFILIMDTKAAEDFTVDMVNHKFTFAELAGIIQSHSQKNA